MSEPPPDESGESALPRRHRGDEFDAFLAGTPPWDIGRPQSAFLRLAEMGGLLGSVLDVGCGTGEHALLAASRGYQATGVDTAPTAIEIARGKASDRGLEARFLVWDALELPSLGQRFDTVLDCGLFHVFDDTDRALFVKSLRTALGVGGHYHMLCFNDRVPGDTGPRRVSRAEIRASFGRGWRVESIEPATLEITVSPEGVAAWISDILRI